MSWSPSDPAFPGYSVDTNETRAAFFAFVVVYTGFSFFLIGVLVSWGRHYEKHRLLSLQSELQHGATPCTESRPAGDTEDHAVVREPENALNSEIVSSTMPDSQASSRRSPEESLSQLHRRVKSRDRNSSDHSTLTKGEGSSSKGRLAIVLRELDRVASTRYPDCDPDFTSRISGQRGGQSAVTSASKSAIERSSGVPSAATTSRLRSANSSVSSGRPRPTQMWDVSGRRWKNRRPIGRVDVIQNAISHETSSAMAGLSPSMTRVGATSSRRSETSKAKMGSSKSLKGMSDVASSVLEEQSNDGRTLFFSRSSTLSRHRYRRSRRGSFSTASERSHMPSIVDDISPNDAADADDPGLGNMFVSIEPPSKTEGFGVKLGCLSSPIESLLALAEPEAEIGRVWRLSIPLTLGAMSEPLFRLITAVFISRYLGTDSMIAFVLVVLFVRLTSEQLSGAIIDALSSFVQAALHSGEGDGGFLAGQYVQHAIVLQLLVGIPTLTVWALTMDNVVDWLMEEGSSSIAYRAHEYTRVIVLNYIVQAVARTCTVVFHICGYERFESIIDFSASALTMVVVACIVSLVDGVSLAMVGYIQVLIGVAAAMAKVVYPLLKGWMRPFQKGMILSVALLENPRAFCQIACAAVPLLVGSILEYGEWELLTLFLRYSGPAEVATWAILGYIWEVLEASTEGMGEAAAIRVAYLLAVAQPEQAKLLSYKVMYCSTIQCLLVSAVLLMFGKHLAVLFTADPTLQHMMDNVFWLLGLGNATMSFAQVSWSLIGAQGRFHLATLVIFVCRWLVTMPIALVCIYGFFLDLNSASGSLVVGYATASCALAYFVLRSDWERLAKIMQDINAQTDLGGVGLDSLEDIDFSDDDDDDDSY